MKFNPNQLDALRVTVMHVLKRHRSPFTANLGQRLNQTNDMQLTIPVVKIGPSEALYAEAIRGTTHGTEDRIAAVKQFRKAQRAEAQRILPKLKACGLTAWIDTSFEIMVRPARSSEVRKRAACIGDTRNASIGDTRNASIGDTRNASIGDTRNASIGDTSK